MDIDGQIYYLVGFNGHSSQCVRVWVSVRILIYVLCAIKTNQLHAVSQLE